MGGARVHGVASVRAREIINIELSVRAETVAIIARQFHCVRVLVLPPRLRDGLLQPGNVHVSDGTRVVGEILANIKER